METCPLGVKCELLLLLVSVVLTANILMILKSATVLRVLFYQVADKQEFIVTLINTEIRPHLEHAVLVT